MKLEVLSPVSETQVQGTGPVTCYAITAVGTLCRTLLVSWWILWFVTMWINHLVDIAAMARAGTQAMAQ
jgi:hypothetical protein